jgi:peptidyl-tRNA hydrolase
MKVIIPCYNPIDSKLYIIVRSDLSPGLQAAQACHALRLFTEEHPEEDKKWYTESNNLVLLQVPNETELLALKERAEADGIPASLFREPDVDNEATALALGPEGRKLLCNLPLLLKAA